MANLKDIIVNGTSRFIGKVFGPTPSEGDYSKQLATTEYVIDNSANQSISNLTEEGESKINASKCLLTNTIVTDPTAYNAVKNYSQDSFDLSKFEVVGSPSISDEGIYVNQTSANYLQIPVPPETENFVLEFELYQERIPWSSGNNALGGGSSFQFGFINININSVGGTDVRLYQSDDTMIAAAGTMTTALGLYKFNFTYQDKTLTETITKPDGTTVSFGVTGEVGGISQTSPFFRIGYYTGGYIDLKTLKFYSNGDLCFTGTNTKIDAIKPLDAEELGDVYVNEHGIVENFNVNNAIKAPISFNPVSTVKIRSLLTWNTGSTQPKDGINVPYVFGPNKWRLEVTSTNIYATNDLDTSTNTAFNITIPELQNGDAIEIIETITTRTRTVKVIVNETDEYSGSTTFAANQAFSTSELAIGNAAFDGSSEYFWNGAINLNMFIVYIDGKLAYEPCLYIPYTQSKTGSKIVENVYRNRVYELYAQTGKAEYYTLDTENENITLPLGEIYGLIASKADTVNVANKSLEDLTDNGNALINNSKAWITGKLTNDKTTYDSIEKLSVSTFDRSKFEVVGSPIISEDGIASGFSTSSYLKIERQLSGLINVNCAWTYYKNASAYAIPFALFFNPSDVTINPVVVSSKNMLTLDGGTGSLIIEEGVTYNLKMVTDFKTFAELYIDDRLISNKIIQKVLDYVYKIYIGTGKNNYPINGSIDLKQFSITVDGKEVFNGNRTELDVIKADNFEVVNTGRTIYAYVYNDGSVNHTIYANSATAPTTLYNEDGTAYTGTDFTVADNVVSYSGNTCTYTAASNITLYINITDDGIASGFSDSNYIQKLSILPTEVGHNYIFKTRYKHITNNFSATGYMFDIATTTGNYFGAMARVQTKTISFVNTITGNAIVLDFDTLVEGKTYDIEYHTDFSTYVKYYVDGDLKQSLTYSATGYPITGNVLIGVTTYAGLPLTMGSVDLNSFKIYVDGNLVYQPCLKIPYTLSKTGSKIVDAAYYDRVVDVYEQYGAAYYYTLDRQNGLSSLPFGDIYGLMMKKDDSPDYFSADTPPEFPFIAWREGYINVTVPANEKLLINGNEVVSAGTSAVQMQLRVGLYDNITFSNTTGATLTFYPCKGVLYTI